MRPTESRADHRAACPTCRRATAMADNRARPFCSMRCKLIDLGSWLEERYRVPGGPLEHREFGADVPPDDDRAG